ncbi:hypothetical protein VCRA2126O85_230044 [Vibrio crassostreae]|nr:hypothetical protein EDB32_12313 [Vibrio crassostreae]CAK2757132.1 hypothetical protein VCRA2128O106_210042 [Vibrio crassostreae]CAK2759572.1 hypothetical protein VCRA2125O83_210043 [Vibrio crassostreae]CAK2759817.1 hypothetical protein VCRA2128O100_230041 [Vibrio crassostreae]CAK2765065.1 hypothetical protein VCRA2127O91_230043 [Vibrio crassostreae]
MMAANFNHKKQGLCRKQGWYPSTLISFNIMTIKFTGHHFPSEIILQSVRYYVSYKLSYREIEELLAERGLSVDHSTLNRWVIKYAPLLEHQARK